MKDKKRVDLTQREDLSMAVMNLISIEEHLEFTAMKTGKEKYIYVLAEVRKLRIKLLKTLLRNTEGEIWCISKHLLAATMRLIETSTKYLDSPKKAMEMINGAFDLYSLFWFIQNLEAEGDEKKKPKHAEKSSK